MRLPLATATLLVALFGPVFTQPPSLPTPEAALGFKPGDDYKLATYFEAVEYFRQLDAASDRLTLVESGRTSYGRPYYFALVSSPENLADVERHRQTAQRLAHPDGLTDSEARRLAQQGRAFVHIDGGLHSTEVAGAQHTLQLAYDLLAGAEEPALRAILDNVILMLWPTINPDGHDIVTKWYREHVGTPFETAPLTELYQKYVGHDNNRDAYMLNMVESRAMARAWRHWEPQIIYVHHQSSPFPTRIWLPPFAEPIAPRVPPLMSRTVNMIGMAIARSLEERGQPGATHMGTGFDAWYPGYVDYMPMLQNINAFWTETALYRYATPHRYTVADFPPRYRDLRSGSLYASPWPAGWWRLRDAVDYMRTASMSVLDYAAKYKEELLFNRYQSGRDQIRRYEHAPPYAYVIPQQQRDPVAPVELLRRLAFNGIAVSQLTAEASIDGATYPQGTWIIPMNQPFAELARQLLEVQVYPDLREYPDGPPDQPYDAAGWTLPLQMGVSVLEAATPLTPAVRGLMRTLRGKAGSGGGAPLLDAAPFDSVPGEGFDTSPLAAPIVPLAGSMAGSGRALSIDRAQNNAFRAVNAAWRAGAKVRVDPERGGRFVVTGLPDAAASRLVRTLALRAEKTNGGGLDLDRPRIGLYQPWNPSMDAGWTEWLLENYGFDFSPLRPADVRGGALRERLDVLVLANESVATLLDGFPAGSVPTHFEGGLGAQGVAAIEQFVTAGGTLVCLNDSSNFAIAQLRLPVKNAAAGLRNHQFFASGSLLEVTTDPGHPLMSGMPEHAVVLVDGSPVFEPLQGFEGEILARYQPEGSPLRSGYLLGERFLHGRAAALDVRLGRGHVVLIGFRPQWRGQPFGTFRVLFNAVLYHGAVAAGAVGAAGSGAGAAASNDPPQPARGPGQASQDVLETHPGRQTARRK
jgi:hypothetical protein